jgi:hypothetical protein
MYVVDAALAEGCGREAMGEDSLGRAVERVLIADRGIPPGVEVACNKPDEDRHYPADNSDVAPQEARRTELVAGEPRVDEDQRDERNQEGEPNQQIE